MPESDSNSPARHIHFVTGRLAETALREVVKTAAKELGFDYSIGVMPITVAALMTPAWLSKRWNVPEQATEVILPGYCGADLQRLQELSDVPICRGPKDLRDLPEYLGAQGKGPADDFGAHNIEIIAEINYAPRFSISDLLAAARTLVDQGADRIDIGCDPGERWNEAGQAVRALVDEGISISIDSFDPWEVDQACRSGASLVLSVNTSNRESAVDWQTEVVAIPDTPEDLQSLDETIEYLQRNKVSFRLDPILEPIGMGFTASLQRYAEVRRRYPDLGMMMGIGNLTELSDVDSAGLNFLLLGICQELSIGSVLTTQVINWARSSVRECDIARRLVHYAVEHRVPPKRLSDALVMLRDSRLRPFPENALQSMAAQIKDNNYRIYAQDGELHLLSANLHLVGTDPFSLFDQLLQLPQSDNVDAGHAFYLGYEMAKAVTALTLSKQYEQDESLDWGFLTVPENHHRITRTSRHRRNREDRRDASR